MSLPCTFDGKSDIDTTIIPRRSGLPIQISKQPTLPGGDNMPGMIRNHEFDYEWTTRAPGRQYGSIEVSGKFRN